MYIKFYNALDQQGLEAGRGRVPKPRQLTPGQHSTPADFSWQEAGNTAAPTGPPFFLSF